MAISNERGVSAESVELVFAEVDSAAGLAGAVRRPNS